MKAHITLEQALEREKREIGQARQADAPWVGMCLSGGGIRSASFCVGVLQGLAQSGCLEHVDYLSSVSGGGYAAAWLSAWLRRAKDKAVAELAGAEEPTPVRHLRLHSSYLSERIGGMGGTTIWVLTYLWNLFLCWCLIAGGLGMALILPAIYIEVVTHHQSWAGYAFVPAAMAELIFGLYVVLDHPGFREEGLPARATILLIPSSLAVFGYSAAALFVSEHPAANRSIWIGVASLFFIILIAGVTRSRFGPVITAMVFYIAMALLLAMTIRIGKGSDEVLTLSLIPAAAVLGLFVTMYLILMWLSNSAVEVDWVNTVGVFAGVTIAWMVIATPIACKTVGILDSTTFALGAVSALVLGCLLDINQLSLHAAYRKRLITAYLAASHGDRRPRPLIGLDRDDDLPMKDLPDRPFLLVNMAARSRQSERSAESFVISKLHAGNETLGFRDSARYAGGLSLGTAMAVSGAAIDPDQTPQNWAVRLLMRMLNTRLGLWLPSTAKACRGWNRARYGTALRPLIHDIFGFSLQSDQYVKLSDGGHFDNLGLYAMVQREPDLILVVDASEDKEYSCGDLGAAMQRVRSDQGAKIELQVDYDKGRSESHSRFGRIEYRSGKKGLICYIKPVLTGDEEPEIKRYKSAHEPFPQHPTMHQLFDEWQFESYRLLGLHSFKSAHGEMLLALSQQTLPVAARLRDQLRNAATAGRGA
jgi:hypothetical protein